jgi:hypothetical protein
VLQQPARDGTQERRSGRVQAARADSDEGCSRCRGNPFELLYRVSRALLELNVKRRQRYISAHGLTHREVAELCEQIAYRVRADACAHVHETKAPADLCREVRGAAGSAPRRQRPIEAADQRARPPRERTDVRLEPARDHEDRARRIGGEPARHPAERVGDRNVARVPTTMSWEPQPSASFAARRPGSPKGTTCRPAPGSPIA